eukprot:CAMPEP_0196718092 /NCGR_PEP_ID=MMETSP1091-20130531/1380_1 /TAXON_ID=302021 /ORGANISM="Rhodomonas sp., Strain CCMP768" /LENGTH=83 /DNA_ID=CAMNT_0042058671 /DNA_START=67 /DNA_END=318 /DNA_ORIENTATION=+
MFEDLHNFLLLREKTHWTTQLLVLTKLQDDSSTDADTDADLSSGPIPGITDDALAIADGWVADLYPPCGDTMSGQGCPPLEES